MDLALRTAVRSRQRSPSRSKVGASAGKSSIVVIARRQATRASTQPNASPTPCAQTSSSPRIGPLTAFRSFEKPASLGDEGMPSSRRGIAATTRRLAARTSTPLAASPNVVHPVLSVHAGVGSSASRSLQESPSHSDAGTPAGKTDLIVTARCRATPTSTSIAPVGNKSAAPPPSPRTRPFACRSLEKSTSTRRRWHTKQQEGHCRDRQTPGYAPHPHTSPPPPRPSRSPSPRHHHPQPPP